ncbi:hypothetical protein niasHS_013863 [Heterodera schachtii]|uniref:Uncharacterized protein n=2 Tax=Heterodera TaxID=34509 RepID=A0ABD2IM08_HETSC
MDSTSIPNLLKIHGALQQKLQTNDDTYRKRPSTHFSPVATVTAKKLLQDVSNLEIPPEIDADNAIPTYAKLFIKQLTTLLGSTTSLLQQQCAAADAVEEDRRQHSLVVIGLPESQEKTPTGRATADKGTAMQILDLCDVEALPITQYRMGKLGTRPRPMKLVLPTRAHVRKCLLMARKKDSALRTQMPTVFIRQSLSGEELKKRSAAIKLCSLLNKNPRFSVHGTFVVYATFHVMLKTQIPLFRNDNSFDGLSVLNIDLNDPALS